MKAVYRAEPADALELFARANVVHLATTDDHGRPLLRTLHGVVIDGSIAFHGGDHGEKLAMLDREAVVTAEEILAEIPSYFIDPERACPATTYYYSAHARGRLRRVTDLERKATILTALMARFQPEGGHVPIAADHPLYTKALDSLLVAELVPDELSAKHKLGQNRGRADMERVMTCLWQRGSPGDLRLIRLLRETHPARPLPALVRGPAGTILCCAPDQADAHAAAALLTGQYWLADASAAAIARAQLGATAWVVARQGERVVATARALSDGERHATVYDVAVAPDLRGHGLGRALLAFLLDHPRLRGCQTIALRTRDAHAFYARHGFAERASPYTEMVMERRSRPPSA